MSWKISFLCCVLVFCTGVAAQADCEDLLHRRADLSARIDGLAAESNAASSSLQACDQEYQSMLQQASKTPPNQRQELLERLEGVLSRCQSLVTSRIATLQSLIGFRDEQCSVMQESNAAGCGNPADTNMCVNALSGHRENLELMRKYEAWCLDQKSRLAQVQDSLDAAASQNANQYPVQNANQATSQGISQGASPGAGSGAGQGAAGQAREDDPPMVVVVNEAGMTVYVHAGGYGGGNSIPPGGSVTYDLSKTRATDQDTGQTFSTKMLVVVGGGVWTGSPYTSYEGMTLCTRRTFGHETGEVAWHIMPGLEANCGVRGYHQPQ